MEYCNANLDTDGKVAMVDLVRAELHADGRTILVKPGQVGPFGLRFCFMERCGAALSV
jgi:hypothetical protein